MLIELFITILTFWQNYKHFAVEYYWLVMCLILKKDIAQIISYWSLTQAGYLRNAAFLKMNFTFLLRNDKKKKNFLKQRWKPLFLLNAAFVYRLFFWITYIVFDLWFSQNNFSFSKSKSYYFGEFTLLVRFMNGDRTKWIRTKRGPPVYGIFNRDFLVWIGKN